MDPITHGTIGLALSAFSGNPVSLTNPLSLGCAIGAMIPDIDAVIRVFSNDMVYLKHHRGITHSVPALAVLSLAVTGALFLAFPEMQFLQVLFWTFIGSLSHTLFDILNSYGAMLFMKKRKASLLTLYDPVVSLMAGYLILVPNQGTVTHLVIPALFALYLCFRYFMRQQAQESLKGIYSHGYTVERIDVLPSLLAFYQWDYIITTRSHQIVGKFNQVTGKNTVRRKLRVQPEFVKLFNQTKAGDYFNAFSSNLHIETEHHPDRLILRATDIRYFMRNRFMHHATVVLDMNHEVMESHIHPYHPDKAVQIIS